MDDEKIRCNFCNSRFGYLKIKDQVWQCRNCGKKTTLKIKEEEKQEE